MGIYRRAGEEYSKTIFTKNLLGVGFYSTSSSRLWRGGFMPLIELYTKNCYIGTIACHAMTIELSAKSLKKRQSRSLKPL
jgi:hypothetical protein